MDVQRAKELIDQQAVEQYFIQLLTEQAKELAKLEVELETNAQARDIRRRRKVTRMKQYWQYADLTRDMVASLYDMTPLQFVAKYGTDNLNRFVMGFKGNASAAAKEAGYSDGGTGSVLLGIPLVFAAIQERDTKDLEGRIASVEELKSVLTNQVYDASLEVSDRQKAIDMLFKSCGAYKEQQVNIFNQYLENQESALKAAQERLERERASGS